MLSEKEQQLPDKTMPPKKEEIRTVIRRVYKNDWKKGVTTQAHVISYDPAVKSSYYILKDIVVGSKNKNNSPRREFRVVFESLEPEENAELLHFLNSEVKP